MVHARRPSRTRSSASTARSTSSRSETGAESIRQLPTLKLFKIRMDLEMSGDTEALAKAAAGRRARRASSRQPYDELDTRRHPRHAGRPAGRLRALRRRRARARHAGRRSCSSTSRACIERGLLRRVAAILFHRRAGFCANGMGVWEVPEDQILEAGRADGRLPRHQPLLPAPDLRRLALPALHDGPRALQGGVRRDPRRDRDEIGCIEDRATLYSSTEFKKVRLLYFTDDFKRWERSTRASALSRLAASRSPTRSRPSCTRRALQRLPGGVNSPVRAMRAIGRDPIFIDRADGAELIDVDGNRYVDYVCSWGPLIHGHAHPEIVEAIVDRRAPRHHASARRPRARSTSPRRSRGACPSVEMLRMTSSGTEASMSAIRLARAATGRDEAAEVRRRLPRPRRRPARRGRQRPGDGRASRPAPACPSPRRTRPSIVPWNDGEAVRRARSPSTSSPRSSPSPTRPTWASSRRVEGFLELLRDQADDNGALLIFDEVITGFRVARRRRAGARGRRCPT